MKLWNSKPCGTLSRLTVEFRLTLIKTFVLRDLLHKKSFIFSQKYSVCFCGRMSL